MGDDGRELEKPAYKRAELVEAISAPVPFDSAGRRRWAERIASAVQEVAAPWYQLELGPTVEERTAAILKEIRDQFYITNKVGLEGTVDAITVVLAKRIAALEGQTRVIQQPPLVADYVPPKGQDGKPIWQPSPGKPRPRARAGEGAMTVEEREQQIRDAIIDEYRKRVEVAFGRASDLQCTIDVLIRRHAQAEEDTQVALETLQHQFEAKLADLTERLDRVEARAAKAAMP